MTTEDAIREARRRWGSGYASDRYWREGDAAGSRFMVTDCKQTYGVSGISFEDAFAEAEKRARGSEVSKP